MGNTNTTTLINRTEENMEIREFRGIYVDENHFFSKITVEAGKQTDIDSTKYRGGDSHGGELSNLMIFCNGSFLQRSSGGDLLLPRDFETVLPRDLVLPGDKFIGYKTATIEPAAEDQNSTGVVKYKVEFQSRKGSAFSLEVFSDSVLNHDNGWTVHCNNGSVKLTGKEGMSMTLDPSKLFASNIVQDPETSLLNVVLKFWPRTFADLNCKDDLRKTICIVNDLMRQAKLCRVDESEADKVVKNVRELHNLCAAMVEWYRPLFPQLENRFPAVAKKILAEVNHQKKLKKFETTIKPLLRRPNSLLGSSS